MYQDLSEKGAIVDRLDLEFERRSDCKDTTATTPATRTKMPLPLTMYTKECGMYVECTGINRKRSAIVD
jgi:hypothetical protein